jgi:hypothetical protein
MLGSEGRPWLRCGDGRKSARRATVRRGRRLSGEAGVGAYIIVSMPGDRLEPIGKVMVGAGDLAEIDLDVALVRQLGDELLDRIDRHHRILVALSSAEAASDNSPSPRSKLPWLRPTPRKLKRKVEKPWRTKHWYSR